MRAPVSAFLGLLLLICTAHGQALDIRGVVSDSATGERIPYANVAIVNTNKGAATNASGFYLIPNVSAGTYEIAASAVGYVRQVKHVIVEGTKPIVVNFRLALEPVRLEEVVISAPAKRELKEIYTSVQVLDKKELQMVPVPVQGDILRSILLLPGFVSTSDVNAQFYVRGGAADQNLILLDGMRIYNPFHAFGLFSIFDPDIVRSAEVYTGAFPADFGGRLSSVINISSREGNALRMAARSNINFLSSKVQLEGPITENIQLIAIGRKSLFSSTFKNFLREDVPLAFYDGLAKLSIKSPDSQDKLTGQVFMSGDDLISSNPTEPDYFWRTKAMGFELNKLLQDRLFVTATLSAGQFKENRDPKQSESATPASTKMEEFTIRATATNYTTASNLYFFGTEFNFPSVEYKFVNRFGLPTTLKSTFPQVAAWMRYQIRAGLVQADAGLRTEIGYLLRGMPAKAALQPRANISCEIFGNWKGKAGYGRVSQEVITATNEDDLIPIFNPWIAVPSKLEPELADHYVLGLEGNPIPQLSTSLQGYYKHYSSLVTYNRDKVDASDPDYINAKAKSYGAEVLIRFSTPLVDLYSAYTLSWVRIDQHGFVYPPRYDRRHALNLLASIRPLRGLDVTARWEIGSGFPFTQSLGFYDRLQLGDLTPNAFVRETGQPYMILGEKNAARLPAYHRLDLSVAYRLTLLSVFRTAIGANVINLYDHKNIFYFDRKTGQRINMLRFFPSANFVLEFVP